MNLDPTLLELLVCPKCHSGLNVNEAEQTLDCRNDGGDCGLRYPVRDDIPVMLIDEAIAPS
ncbi:MAG TPA: Trm112 family protein [Mycobacteriales bacterium]|nr:Trm112 family protein [Mycobacteriales bacterium]